MIAKRQELWVQVGYSAFAESGPASLKIEALARQIAINKSSFYHHFADLELFIEQLLKKHINRVKSLAQAERGAERLDPDLIGILMAFRVDLLFHKQLRMHPEKKGFSRALAQANEIMNDVFIRVWSKDIGHQLSQPQMAGIYTLALDHFFSNIHTTTLDARWLTAYFKDLNKTARLFYR